MKFIIYRKIFSAFFSFKICCIAFYVLFYITFKLQVISNVTFVSMKIETGFPRSLKVFKSFEICNYEFKALKVLEFYLRSLKVLEFWVLIFFFMRPTSTRAYNILYNTCVRTVTVANRIGWQSIAI